jgi:uncharacterized membrane protein
LKLSREATLSIVYGILFLILILLLGFWVGSRIWGLLVILGIIGEYLVVYLKSRKKKREVS